MNCGASRKTIEKVFEYVDSTNGVDSTEISKAIGKSNGCVRAALTQLEKECRVTKGLKRNVLSTGQLSDNLTPAYYAEV